MSKETCCGDCTDLIGEGWTPERYRAKICRLRGLLSKAREEAARARAKASIEESRRVAVERRLEAFVGTWMVYGQHNNNSDDRERREDLEGEVL